jgi:hypothetical protein
MAIFKAPRISKAQREALTLDASEIVYDTTTNNYFGGDGLTLGGFPIGKGSSLITDKIEITQENIDNKSVELSQIPLYPSSVTLTFMGGIHQENGVDFEVTSNVISWNGLGLDGFIELGDNLVIQY